MNEECAKIGEWIIIRSCKSIHKVMGYVTFGNDDRYKIEEIFNKEYFHISTVSISDTEKLSPLELTWYGINKEKI